MTHQRYLLTFVSVVLATFALTTVSYGQSNPPARATVSGATISPPSVMHICLANCMTWTLDKGAPFDKPHYGSVASGGIIIVDSWTRESVVMNRTDYNVPGKAVLTGKLSSDGNSMVGGNITWTWHPCCGTASGPYTAAWGPAINTVPGTNEERDRILASTNVARSPTAVRNVQSDQQPEQPPPASSRISLPPGASPKFASLPADIRAALRPESAVLPTQLKLPCAAAAAEPDAADALEIGKFAWRAADYSRGYCWIKRSADLGNVRAKVLLGVAAVMGWGVPQSWNAAFQYFKAQAEPATDAWAVYFTEQCYEKGLGTPVDRDRATGLLAWLTFRPEGRALFWSIGDDDAEMHRQYERTMLMLNPPVSERTVCTVAPGATHETCHTEQHVDQEQLQQEIDAVDRKFGN